MIHGHARAIFHGDKQKSHFSFLPDFTRPTHRGIQKQWLLHRKQKRDDG
jgi:hypothetical protein